MVRSIIGRHRLADLLKTMNVHLDVSRITRRRFAPNFSEGKALSVTVMLGRRVKLTHKEHRGGTG
jgi:hypothetical protein